MQKYMKLFCMSCLITMTMFSAMATDDQLSIARQVMKAKRPVTKVMADEYMSVYVQRGGGFVVMTADKQSPRVLAYSTSATLQPGSYNPGFNWWLRSIGQALQSKKGQLVKTTKPDLERFAPSIDPLTTSLWGQRAPFNYMCPLNSYYTDYSLYGTYQPDMAHYVVGCVATAMAQYMYYYRFPKHGVGQDSIIVKYPIEGQSSSYTNNVVCSVDFENSVYDWDNMIDDYQGDYTPQQGEAVAKLCYHCGVAAQTVYNSLGAGSNDSKCLEAFRKHFNYNDTAHFIVRTNYDEPEWMEMVYTELNNSHPIFYSGKDINVGAGIFTGHNFIIDGYDENGLVHVNWGWYGLENGYFDIALLDVNIYTYDDWQAMYVGLYPNQEHIVGDLDGSGIVDIDDLNIVINIILGYTNAEQYGNSAFITDDDIVDIEDVNAIINIILKQ